MKASYIIAFIIPLLLVMATWAVIMPEFNEIPMKVKIGNSVIGIDVNTTALTFGTVFNGGSSNRTLVIVNSDNYDKIAYLRAEGSMTDAMMADAMNFPKEVRVKASANTTVNIFVNIPNEAEVGGYTGTLKLFLIRAI